MTQHSYEKCYNLLNINIDCNWQDLRKSYRGLVHKWHPDRYKDDREKALATDKIKDLNAAYKQLSNYYNKHGVLPLSTPPLQTPTPSSSIEKEKFNHDKATKDSFIKKRSVNKKRKINLQSVFTFSIAPIMMVIIYQNLDSIVMSMSNSYDSAEEPLPGKISVIKNKADTKQKIKVKTKVKYFTYGSSLGEVILIQGPPDNMIGNIWFYGKSEIHFKDGFVIKWLRTANNPLYAQAILIPDNKKIETKDTGLR